jgi:hypothetical protein
MDVFGEKLENNNFIEVYYVVTNGEVQIELTHLHLVEELLIIMEILLQMEFH